MSFIERNKVWLLPLLGVGVLGVVWMNVQTFKPKKPPVALPPPAPAAATPSNAAPEPAPAPVPVAPAPEPAPVPAGGADLWSDLRPLEAPSPRLSQADEMLKEGARPVEVSRLGQPAEPELDPRSWQALPEPRFPKVATASAAPKAPSATPVLGLILEGSGGVREAWFGGRPYREGQSPDGAHRIKQILRWSVLLTGPTGEIRLSTELGRAKSARPGASAEAM